MLRTALGRRQAFGEKWLRFPVAAITAASVPPAISTLGHERERPWLDLDGEDRARLPEAGRHETPTARLRRELR
jgi:hypothetical protein